MKRIAIIPARGGSKGIPYKNIIILKRKPLIVYTIEAAKKSRIFDRVIVSTDNKKIQLIAKKYGAEVILRPKNIAQDKTPTEPVMLHVLDWLKKKENYQPDLVFLLQPTSPLRNNRDIEAAYKEFINKDLDSLLSVTNNKAFIWLKTGSKLRALNYNYLKRPRRQEMIGQFRENGAIYITKFDIIKKRSNRLGGRIGCYVMDELRSIDIDNYFDLVSAKQILERKICKK